MTMKHKRKQAWIPIKNTDAAKAKYFPCSFVFQPKFWTILPIPDEILIPHIQILNERAKQKRIVINYNKFTLLSIDSIFKVLRVKELNFSPRLEVEIKKAKF